MNIVHCSEAHGSCLSNNTGNIADRDLVTCAVCNNWPHSDPEPVLAVSGHCLYYVLSAVQLDIFPDGCAGWTRSRDQKQTIANGSLRGPRGLFTCPSCILLASGLHHQYDQPVCPIATEQANQLLANKLAKNCNCYLRYLLARSPSYCTTMPRHAELRLHRVQTDKTRHRPLVVIIADRISQLLSRRCALWIQL